MSLIPCSLSSIMASLNATSLSRSITSCLHVFVQEQESMKVVWIFQQKQQRCSFFPSLKKMNLQGVCQDFNEKKKGSQSGLRVASLHWYVKKRATQNTLQKKTHDYNPITKRKDKQQPNEYKHNHNRRKIDNNYLLKLLYRQCNWFDSVHINRFANSTVLIYPDILANDNSKFQKEAAETLIHESGVRVGK
jgi:hypothetical protein